MKCPGRSVRNENPCRSCKKQQKKELLWENYYDREKDKNCPAGIPCFEKVAKITKKYCEPCKKRKAFIKADHDPIRKNHGIDYNTYFFANHTQNLKHQKRSLE
jgi:hypothetical protein